MKAFTREAVGLCERVTEVIRSNQLNALVFIWDEFTEYFHNNMTSLTGFQRLLELSETEHFLFIPVTPLDYLLLPFFSFVLFQPYPELPDPLSIAKIFLLHAFVYSQF